MILVRTSTFQLKIDVLQSQAINNIYSHCVLQNIYWGSKCCKYHTWSAAIFRENQLSTLKRPCCLSSLSLQWRHNGRDSVWNHQPYDCLLNRLFRRRSKKTSKLRVTGLCAGNWPGTGEFPAQMASNAENVSIWWCHHDQVYFLNGLSLKVWILASVSSILTPQYMPNHETPCRKDWYYLKQHESHSNVVIKCYWAFVTNAIELKTCVHDLWLHIDNEPRIQGKL